MLARPLCSHSAQHPRQCGAIPPNIHASVVPFRPTSTSVWCHSTQKSITQCGEPLILGSSSEAMKKHHEPEVKVRRFFQKKAVGPGTHCSPRS